MRQNFKIARERTSFLAGREARQGAPDGGANAPQNRGQNQWAALCAANDLALKKPTSFVLVWLYNRTRTYFIANT